MDREPTRVLNNVIEPARKAARLSQRRAADRAGMSEATWRQLVAGGTTQYGVWINRIARRDQLLDMAHAVGCLEEVADEIKASEDEVAYARERVTIPDAAEVEILTSRHLNNAEKLALLEALRQLRNAHLTTTP